MCNFIKYVKRIVAMKDGEWNGLDMDCCLWRFMRTQNLCIMYGIHELTFIFDTKLNLFYIF